jgi:hypothetical protein
MNFFPAVKFYNFDHQIGIDLKCWIQILIETNADPQHWSEVPGVLSIEMDLAESYLIRKIFIKGTQDWEFFWLRFWNLRYFFVRYA